MKQPELIKTLAPIVAADSQILILGTVPGPLALAKGEYFAHPRNQFWRLLFAVYEHGFSEEYEERKKLLKTYKIALWEVLETCERKGSADQNIKNETPNNLLFLLKTHPEIKFIFFDSKAAAKFYDRYFPRWEGILYETLPSPSPAYASLSFEEKLEKWRAIKMRH